jgi:hypothetical protein
MKIKKGAETTKANKKTVEAQLTIAGVVEKKVAEVSTTGEYVNHYCMRVRPD